MSYATGERRNNLECDTAERARSLVVSAGRFVRSGEMSCEVCGRVLVIQSSSFAT